MALYRFRRIVNRKELGELDRDIASPVRPCKLRQTGSRALSVTEKKLESSEQQTDQIKGVPEERKAGRDLSEPDKKRKLDAVSGSSSPLSPASQATSPTLAQPKQRPESVRPSRSSSSSSLDSHQPPPAPSIPQFQTFGPDPLTFDDPTIYHIRKVTDDMTDEEKKEIYSVSHFPHDDLSHLIAGTPPDKDFSNAKPSNQVNANTFAAYIDPYLRPLTEEDMAFLKERVNPMHILLLID